MYQESKATSESKLLYRSEEERVWLLKREEVAFHLHTHEKEVPLFTAA
jgi:hypothetical protein